jgi:hypothetical protein
MLCDDVVIEAMEMEEMSGESGQEGQERRCNEQVEWNRMVLPGYET